jgi:ATP-dependent DNA helicase RecQ
MTGPAQYDPAAALARFGLSSFRPGQLEVISAVLAGDDCLCIMPTGGGKSLCYQLPSVVRPGVTLVISPLIALMKDQVDALARLGLRATFVNSSLAPAEQNERIDAMAAGAYDLVYVAPERFRSGRFAEAAAASKVQLLAVDEAHCISEWGHDFRPDYARIGQFRRQVGNPQTMALTATATPRVREDVVRLLQMKSPKTFITGFARPNLHFEVLFPSGNQAKDAALLAALEEADGPAIVYAATRKRCEDIAETILENTAARAGIYHAGMAPDERRRVQDDFMGGKCRVVAATNAFGMGIDKADLRLVVHYNMPGSLEAYYQEAGRAGRDGLPSRCLMLFSGADRYIQEFFIETAHPSRETVAQVHRFLCGLNDNPIEMTQDEVKETLRLPIGSEGVGTCEQLLEKCGVLERLAARQNMAMVRLDSDLPTLVDLLPAAAHVRRKVMRAVEKVVGQRRRQAVYVHPPQLAAAAGMEPAALARVLRELAELDAVEYLPPFRGRAIRMVRRDIPFEKLPIDFEAIERRRAAEYEKLDRVAAYAFAKGCRQLNITGYFGDPSIEPCGTCDHCGDRAGSPPSRGAAMPRRAEREKGRRSAPAAAAVATAARDDDAVLTAVRMALSGVARAHGKFGKGVIAQMLCGSKSSKMAKWRLDRLSTFGLLNDLKQSDVSALLDELLRVGLVQQDEVDRFRPVVLLTDQGEEVMHGRAPLPRKLRLPPELAVKLGGIDAAANARPGDRAKAAAPSAPRQGARPPALPPEGPPDDIEEEAAKPLGRPASEAPGPTSGSGESDGAVVERPSYFWTWQLLADGYSLAQCCAIRGLAEESVVDHLLLAAETGLHVELEWVLSSAQAAALASAVGDALPERIVPLLERLPAGTRHEHVLLFHKCRAFRAGVSRSGSR